MGREDFEDRKRELKQQFPGWHIWYVPRPTGEGATWCAQPDPAISAGSPAELAERIRIAHMAVPDGSAPLASWRSYLARARKRREHDDAVAKTWREKNPGTGGRGHGARPRRRPGHPAQLD